MEIVLFEFLSGMRTSAPSVWCLTKRQAFGSGELCWPGNWAVCDLVTHPQLQTVPSRAHVRTKQASSGGATRAVLWHSVACWWVCRSLAVNGPPMAPLLVPWPLVFPSQYTHTKRRHWHRATFTTCSPSKRTWSPLTDMFVQCNVCWCPQLTLWMWCSPGCGEVVPTALWQFANLDMKDI